jgi:hypothetical protein
MRMTESLTITAAALDQAIEPVLDPLAAARAASLRYVSDTTPGITRRGAGTGFAYRDAEGHAIRDRAVLRRIKALAVPLAWQSVWICPYANGHTRPSAATRVGASDIATIRAGGWCATRRNTEGCCSSAVCCRAYAPG